MIEGRLLVGMRVGSATSGANRSLMRMSANGKEGYGHMRTREGWVKSTEFCPNVLYEGFLSQHKLNLGYTSSLCGQCERYNDRH